MEDKKKKISDNLSKNLPAKRMDRPLTDKDVKDDYDFSRRTYKDLITTGVRSLDVLAELARESEHPRAFEVLSKSGSAHCGYCNSGYGNSTISTQIYLDL